MRTLAMIVAFLLATAARAEDKKVDHTVHSGYAESNKSGLKGASSHIVVTDHATFDKTFISPFRPGKKPVLVPKGTFPKKFVVAVITRGKTIYEYSDVKVTADGATLKVAYKVKPVGNPGSARFASPLVISLDKGKYKTVVFDANGKEAAKVKLK